MGRFVALAAALLTLGACEGPPSHGKPWRKPLPEPPPLTRPEGSAAARADAALEAAKKRAHTLRIHLVAEPSHLHPLLDPDLETLRVTEGTIFESLVTLAPAGDPAAAWGVAPQLAETFRVIGDGRELRFTLRDGVRFHDGGRLSVVDAQFSLDTARFRAPRFREALADVMTVEIAGTRELKVTLRKPNAYVLRAIAEVPILSSNVYGPGGQAWHGAKKIAIGTGPFRLARWDRGARIVLARNESYWGGAPASPPPATPDAPAPAPVAESAVDEVEFVIEPDAARALMRAKRDEIDILPALSWAHVPAQVVAMAPAFAPVRLAPPRLRYLVFNTARPPFDDARVREAVSLVIDRRRLADELLHGTVRLVGGPVWPGGPGDAAATPEPRTDLGAAAQLLDEAGWVDAEKDGTRDRAGVALKVVLLTGQDARGEAERELVVSALRKAGFQVEVRAGDPAVLLARLKDGVFDLATVEWRARVDEDLTPLFGTGGARNWGAFTSKALDALLVAAQTAWDPAQRAARVAEVGRAVASEWPIAALYAPAPLGLVHTRVHGLVVHDGWFAIRGITLAP